MNEGGGTPSEGSGDETVHRQRWPRPLAHTGHCCGSDRVSGFTSLAVQRATL